MKVLTGLERKVEGPNENFNQEKNVKKESELENTITEMTNILEGVSSRLPDAEEPISDLENNRTAKGENNFEK